MMLTFLSHRCGSAVAEKNSKERDGSRTRLKSHSDQVHFGALGTGESLGGLG